MNSRRVKSNEGGCSMSKEFNSHNGLTATRRTALKGAVAAGATLAMPGIVRALGDETIKIGFISPVTGPLGLFGETDTYTLDKMRKRLANGLEIGGKTYQVKVIDRDAQSDPNKA